MFLRPSTACQYAKKYLPGTIRTPSFPPVMEQAKGILRILQQYQDQRPELETATNAVCYAGIFFRGCKQEYFSLSS